jgi:lysine 6-dehydrogenase
MEPILPNISNDKEIVHLAPNAPYNYLIIGAGRQGTAAAYDLARFGEAKSITMADIDFNTAQKAALRINQLLDTTVALAKQLDVTDPQSLTEAMQGQSAALSAVPYYYNLPITHAAISAGVHLCDMGGNTDIVWKQLELDEEARHAGVSIVPDCGMGPGLINTMAAYAIDLLDEPEEIYIYDAGLPQEPISPWNYQLTFHINGLTNEMDGQAIFVRDGEIVKVDTLSEPEFLHFDPLGKLEADVTSGGTSTAPWTFKDRIRCYENKVLRYPGHFEWLRAFKALGLFSEVPVQVGSQSVVPRQVYHTLLEPKITAPTIKDMCVIRAKGLGKKWGKKASVEVDLIDYFDEASGFTSMERLTGWHCSIMMIFQVGGRVRTGGIPMETAVPAADFMDELARRGIKFDVRWV